MGDIKKIYLDYNATTPVDRRVLEAMLPYFTEHFGNASSTAHAYGWDAEEAVDVARHQVAGLIGTGPAGITFTSGATEAIYMALVGVMQAYRDKGDHLITCRTEHRAVLDTCEYLERQGKKVTYLDVDSEGAIDLAELQAAISDRTVMVCLMAANNETGVLHPLADISRITGRHDILLMTDATQAVGKVPFDVKGAGVDIAAFSAHKLYGPKGVGALYLRRKPGVKTARVLTGGGQEKGLRPGTLNVPAIVGFGKACELCHEEMQAEGIRLQGLRDRLEKGLLEVPGSQVNGAGSPRLAHVSNMSFAGREGDKLLRSLKHIAVSQGSACTSNTVEPSHVLEAMGLPAETALASLRISLGRYTTEQDIGAAIRDIISSTEKVVTL
ncbi:MAG: cysteine desulfurase family protein [Cyclobacteriaceae bacterium]